MRTAFRVLMATGLLFTAQAAYCQDCESSPDGCHSDPSPPPSAPSMPTLRAPLFNGYAYGQIGGFASSIDDHRFTNATGGAVGGAIRDDGGSASGSYSARNTQSLRADGYAASNGSNNHTYSGGGDGDLLYYLGVYGPNAAIVPLIARGSLMTSALPSATSGASYSQASFSLYAPNDGYTGGSGYDVEDHTAVSKMTCDSGGLQPGCGIQNFEIHFDLSTTDFATLYLQAEASGTAGVYDLIHPAGVGEAHALADPTFSIDPTWLAGHPGYQLALSNGIANGVAAVPESSTWAMMIIGFGVIGSGMRRRRQIQLAETIEAQG